MSGDWTCVTGANGFLGARLVRQIVEQGGSVRALVRAGSNLSELRDLPSDRVRIAVGDVTMVDRVYAALRGCNRLFHVATATQVDERHRTEIIAAAEGGTRATLEAARLAGVDRVVVTSSLFTIGAEPKPEPLNEESKFRLRNPSAYTAAKLAGEKVALEYAEAGLNVVVVNPAMLVGPGDHKPTPTGQTIVNYLGLSPTLRVPYPAGGFNYIDVDKAAQGHILAMQKGRSGQRYILGGEDLTHQEFVRMLADITGLAEPGDQASEGRLRWLAWLEEWRARGTGRQPAMTRSLVDDYYDRYVYVSSAKAREELGYEPEPVRPAVAAAVRWFLDNGYTSERSRRRVRIELEPAETSGG